jgi:multidrug transporter EmrE-like cation transporter
MGLYLVKVASGYFTPAFIGGLLLYALGAGLWIFILRHLPLSVAFPLAAGLLMIATTLTGKFFLGEPVSALMIFGMLLILAGIASISYAKVN